jgi:prephenate dehydrogenase
MKIGIIGTGLIGGSLAFSLRKSGLASEILAAHYSEEETRVVLERKIADHVVSLETICLNSELIIIAVPVNAIAMILPQVLNLISAKTVVIDVGSTKEIICNAIKHHPKRKQFVASHPIAGTENNGPNAAIDNLFEGKLNIICDAEDSSYDAVELAEKVFSSVGMNSIKMSGNEHDRHLAYVSHLSHISSFMLGLTVLDIEKDERNIFNLAGSGFESTVRLAKSSSAMWAPIFMENKANILTALNSYIGNLELIRDLINQEDIEETKTLLDKANEVRKVLDNKEKNTLIK